jgi:hypothetical protein
MPLASSPLPLPPPAPARAVLLWAALRAVALRAGPLSGGDDRSDGFAALSLTSAVEHLRTGAWASGLLAGAQPTDNNSSASASDGRSDGRSRQSCPPPTLEAVQAAAARLAPQADATLAAHRATRAERAAQRLARRSAAAAAVSADEERDEDGGGEARDTNTRAFQPRPRGKSPRRPARAVSPRPVNWRARVAKGINFM